MRVSFAAVLAAAGMLLAACGGGGNAGPIGTASDVPALTVSSSTVTDGATLPTSVTCAGAGEVPDLSWDHGPDGTAAYVVVVEDPDAPHGTFLHWAVANVPSDMTQLSPDGLPGGAVEGTNGFGDVGWGPPCPPTGDAAHRYRFTVMAVDTTLDLDRGFAASALRDAVRGHVLAQGTLTASFARSG